MAGNTPNKISITCRTRCYHTIYSCSRCLERARPRFLQVEFVFQDMRKLLLAVFSCRLKAHTSRSRQDMSLRRIYDPENLQKDFGFQVK